ncbi:exo-beta-1,3-glucanase [Mycena belliarum]|uniref:glucan 1,3-beta-glucosidase n=1 Tax=Mycena belliarum TaxID=1033014 RepID=A0AAD6XPT5_9AGAR|nr:exo-beta-1,3-glucanase [Mycena belliae]
MAQPPPSAHTVYTPLPLTTDDSQPNALYNAPPSPHGSSFHVPTQDQDGLPYTDDMGIPMGAAQPRFLGRALYDDGGAPSMRSSIASSHNPYSHDRSSAYTTDSTYNLNAAPAPISRGFTESSYRDEPGFFVGEQPVRRRDEKGSAYGSTTKSRRRPIIIGVGILVLLLAVVGVALALTVFKSKIGSSGSSPSSGSSGSAPGSTASGTPAGKIAIVTGTDGSKVIADDGSTFTYSNPYGGTWYWDENDPFNNGARAQSWTPALNETFRYGVDKIRGVNIGGWLVTEPFIVPALYQNVQATTTTVTVIDEWTLIQAGGSAALEEHYKTFITEQDFMQIAAAGLNYVRIPIGFWAIEVLDGENFLPKTSWTYLLKAIQWARKYGLRINLDLHALPGSQNGWNHSGRLGSFNVLYGPMGLVNAQRSLDYIRIIAEFISQPEYRDVVTMFGVTNEPQGNQIGIDNLSSYYLQAYNNVRLASGIGEGKGPFISFHDGFLGLGKWDGFLPNADRASMDLHPYLCFSTQSTAPISTYGTRPCDSWGGQFNSTMKNFGFVVAGEFSNAVTDCGLYVNGVGQGVRYEGTYTSDGPWPKLGNCASDWLDYPNWDAATKKAYMTFALASMDALQNFFFWTWKVGNSTAGKVEAPHWSYQLGLENGWMPRDPRSAAGQCGNTSPFVGTLSSWQTGGAGAGNFDPAVTNALAWPPAAISTPGGSFPINILPTLTPTGAVVTLPPPTFTSVSGQPAATASLNVGNGWANPGDTAGMMKPIAGCKYLDPWIGPVQPPAPLCDNARRQLPFGKASTTDAAPAATITAPP